MKKIAVLLSMGMLMFTLSACGNDDNKGQGEEQSSEVQSSEQTGEAVGGDTMDNGNAQEESQATDNGTDSEGMNTTGNWSEDMQVVKQALVDTLGENYWPNTAITSEMLEEAYGIAPDMYEDYFAEMPMISTNVDTIIIVKAKEEQVDAVEEAMNAYRDKMVNDTMQYPMNLGKIQASRIERIGNYVCFVQLGADTMAAMEKGDEEVIKQCQEQNELAIAVIEQNVRH